MRSTLSLIIFATVALLAFPGTGLANIDRVTRVSIENLGYKVVASSKPELLAWEQDLGVVRKSVYAIRRNRQVPGKPNGYYRFTIKVEEYASEDRAQDRVELMDSTPPAPDSIRNAPEFDYRMGFRRGKTVWVVSTNHYAPVYDGALASVTSKFEEWITDASPE